MSFNDRGMPVRPKEPDCAMRGGLDRFDYSVYRLPPELQKGDLVKKGQEIRLRVGRLLPNPASVTAERVQLTTVKFRPRVVRVVCPPGQENNPHLFMLGDMLERGGLVVRRMFVFITPFFKAGLMKVA
jgi:hypothetical protein